MSELAGHDARDRERFVFHETPGRRAMLALVRVLFRPVMKLCVEGLENVPVQGGCILACNHLSNWDVFAMQLALPRTIFFMGKAELFRVAPLGAVLRDFGAFPVYRGEKDAWALMHARRVLDAGQVLGMFPEGHRSKGRGLLPAKTGTARLALESNCAILPMAITGSDKLLHSFPRRTEVRVAFLPLLHAREDETPEDLTTRLMFRLAAALPPELRGAYAGHYL